MLLLSPPLCTPSRTRYQPAMSSTTWIAQPHQQSLLLQKGRGRHPRVAPRAATSAAVQFPPYTIINSSNTYDLRLYQPHIVVQIPYTTRDEGYDALGGYFDGRNSDNLRFAESQPVTMTYHPDAPPPLPDNPRVTLEAAGGEVVAVLRFEGFITPETASAARDKLIACLQQDGLKLAAPEAGGMFRVCQYGPLYSLGRVNDLLLAVNV